MTGRDIISHLRHHPQDGFYYWQGKWRYALYRHRVGRWLLRWHIRDQYEQRKVWARPCYYAGECQCCGCETPSVFFAAKGCSAGSGKFPHCQGMVSCYPALMSQTEWYWYRLKQTYV